MAYATYTTKALVCGSHNSYTSDRSYLLFTREAGILWATARSVREEKSKQRSSLQDFSLIRVSLVKGKGGWRIGSVEALGNPFLAATSRAQRGFVSYIVTQIRRYIHGESSLAETFDDTVFILERKNKEENFVPIQTVFLLRLLNELGYISPSEKIAPLVLEKNIETAINQYDEKNSYYIEKVIENARNESHL